MVQLWFNWCNAFCSGKTKFTPIDVKSYCEKRSSLWSGPDDILEEEDEDGKLGSEDWCVHVIDVLFIARATAQLLVTLDTTRTLLPYLSYLM